MPFPTDECVVQVLEGTRDSAGVKVLTKLVIDHDGGGARFRAKTLALCGIALGRIVSMSWRNFQPLFLQGLRSSFDYALCILVVDIIQSQNIHTLRAV